MRITKVLGNTKAGWCHGAYSFFIRLREAGKIEVLVVGLNVQVLSTIRGVHHVFWSELPNIPLSHPDDVVKIRCFVSRGVQGRPGGVRHVGEAWRPKIRELDTMIGRMPDVTFGGSTVSPRSGF